MNLSYRESEKGLWLAVVKKIRATIKIKPENYCAKLNVKDALWQPKYDAFNIFSEARLNGKLAYMHNHPVQAGLVNDAKDWKLGSAPS